MGAISLYRGNFHRFSDVTRRWPMPPRTISLNEFRHILRKRNRTASRFASENPNLNSSSNTSVTGCLTNVPISVASNAVPSGSDVPSLSNRNNQAELLKDSSNCETVVAVSVDQPALVGGGSSENIDLPVGCGDNGSAKQVLCELDAEEKEARKREIEKKLDGLNERKHYLVQMLKQILNAEEEIKRRSIQSTTTRSSAPQQTEALAQTSCAARNPPKISVEVNFAGDVGGESDAAIIRPIQARQFPSVPATSPSSASLGKTLPTPFHRTTARTPRGNAPHQVTTSSLLMASPPCLVPTTVSFSGNHFGAASSISPAASAGTSSPFRFRDFCT